MLLAVLVAFGLVVYSFELHTKEMAARGESVNWSKSKQLIGIALMSGVGRLFRLAFFVVTGFGLLIYAESIREGGIGDIPFSSLTLNVLIDGLWRGLWLAGGIWLWFSWAFTKAPKNYRHWIGFGLAACGGTVLLSIFLGYKLSFWALITI